MPAKPMAPTGAGEDQTIDRGDEGLVSAQSRADPPPGRGSACLRIRRAPPALFRRWTR